MRADAPRGHGTVLEGLWRAAGEGRLPHALLLEGPRGIGKFLAAKRLALGLLCAGGPGEPCGTCGPCKRVLGGGARGNHPDLHVVDAAEEGEESIRVRRVAIRDDSEGETIESFLGLRAMEGGWRIVLVREAHRMLVPAQNALLKTLEEPTPGTLLVLETHRPAGLLPTIRSRCVRVRLARPSPEDAAVILREAGVAPDEAARLARWASGSPGDALALAARGGAALRALLADVLLGRRDPLEAARALGDLEGRFEGGTPAARERDRARTALDLALALVGDARRAAEGADPDGLAHGDVAPAARALGRDEVDRLLEARADVERNLQTAPLLERALLVLAGADPVPSTGRG